ncbi:MAG: radical SAM protein [Candidatus Thermoplasmatota archaeon]
MKIGILDGYVDEPTCLGVPPYISPYVRYIAGAVLQVDPKNHLVYYTIDQVRSNHSLISVLDSVDVVVVNAGISVPGKYLSGMPASPPELYRVLSSLQKPVKVLTGPAAQYGFGTTGGHKTKDVRELGEIFDLIVTGDGELGVYDLLVNYFKRDSVDPSRCRQNPHDIYQFSVKGAEIVRKHPFFPEYLIAEIETYRGCSRSITGGCSFCSEPRKGSPQFRPIQDIIDEVSALYGQGIRHIRLGNQPCLFSYMAHDAGRLEFPKPNPDALEKLFAGIRMQAPGLETVHIDNANPAVLATYPYECRLIAKTIIKYHSSGDVAAFGVESVDPVVIKYNNLKASAEDVLVAIRLLNEVGAARGTNGLPELLPGLNFVGGLIGETKKTYELNYDFLQRIVEEGLLLRRINIRQVIPITGTRIYSEVGDRLIRRHREEFQRFKHRVRSTIDRQLLQKLVPPGTVLSKVFTELHEGKVTFARQLGSYPLLVGIPGIFPLHHFFDVKIVDYGYRSVTAIPFPLDVNTAPRETLEAVPGLGRKRVIRLLRQRPFSSKEHLIDAFDDQMVGRDFIVFITEK